MILNLNIFLKIFLFFIFIFLSFYFFYYGYQELKNIKFANLLKIEKKEKINLEEKIIENNSLDISESIVSKKIIKSTVFEKKVVLIVKENDTFDGLVSPFIENNQIKQKIINEINKHFNLKKLYVGQKIFLYISNINNNEISKIVIPLNFNTDLIVKKNKNSNAYSTNKVNLPITTELVAHKYNISKSLFEDGQRDRVPLAVLSEVIRLYSFDIDFQRDIQKGNQLEILYNVAYNEKREKVSYGDIEYANLILKNKNLEYFLFKTSDGFLDYFNKEGKNVKKTLMKTPLDGARISSSFGIRKHPISGYTKKHQGVDFAASKGTPVYAAGNGVIEFVGRNGGYGKYIRIRHNSSYKTGYAHLNGYKKGISKGIRVNQGQTIGFIGSTGRSTGPHLHYEVIYQNKQINPMTMKLPSGKILKEKELESFKETFKKIYANFLFYLYE